MLYASRVQIGHQTHSFIRCLLSQRCPPLGITMLQQANTLESEAPGKKTHSNIHTHKCFFKCNHIMSFQTCMLLLQSMSTRQFCTLHDSISELRHRGILSVNNDLQFRLQATCMKLFVILELNRPSPYLTFIKQKVVANTSLKMYPSTQDHAQTF